ncbi:MAG: class I SAM-dependent methyltransferase [Betaproteobacteria bacterium]|nr:class I SAM-dependent methyltransferase [Betaproteobacteria bacterium]
MSPRTSSARAPLSEYERYHHTQYEQPYDSTIALEGFIRRIAGPPSGILMDVGCGAGAVLHYFNACGLTEMCGTVGVDNDMDLLRIADERHDSWSWLHGDIAQPLPECDYSISVQVLSFIEDWRAPLEQQLHATREWAFFTSLFWPGVSAHIHASDAEKRDAHYNIIAQGTFEAACRAAGAQRIVWERYTAPRPIEAPAEALRSRTERGYMFSGPLLLPWWMVGVRMTEDVGGA